MQNKNNSWEDIVINWNQVDSELNNDTHQINDLKNQLKNKNTTSTIEVVFGLLVGFAFCAYIITEIIKGLPSIMDYILYSGILIIILMSIFIPLSIKSRGLKDKAKNSCDYLNLLFKQSQMTQKILKLSKLSCASLFFLCYGIILWVFILWLQSNHEFAKPIYALSLVAFVSLFFPSIYYLLKVQQTKTSNYQNQLQNMINECNELV